jgi:hypothetical protein
MRTKNKVFRTSMLSMLALTISLGTASTLTAQPVVDSVKSLQKRNDQQYRLLTGMDDVGDSYSFTNVVQWRITDGDLNARIREALEKEPFNLKRDEFDVTNTYIFAAPAGIDRVEPFHILVKGFRKEKATGKKKSGLGMFEDDDDGAGGVEIPIAFKGKPVVRLFHRTPALFEDLNIVQGENVELPGEIVPTGAQLVKSSEMRYVLSRMFDGFYAKPVILDAQRAFYGLPTSDFQFDELKLAEAQESIGEEGEQTTIDTTLGEVQKQIMDETAIQKFARSEKTVDLSLNHLWVTANKNIRFEVELGNAEVGLPFWTSGQGRFWVNLRNMIGTESNFKLGLAFPLDLGDEDAALWSARKLSGGWGGSIAAYFAGIDFFSAFNLPLALNLTVNPAPTANGSIIRNGQELFGVNTVNGNTTAINIPENETFYRTSLIAQLYVPTIVQLDLHNFVQFSAGIGIHNVMQSMIPSLLSGKGKKYYTKGVGGGPNPIFAEDIDPDKAQDIRRVSVPFTPHVTVEYVNHRASKFGLSAAYDHLFTFGGWIELIEDHLRLEVGFTTPLLRDAKPWEPDNFFQITPRIYF